MNEPDSTPADEPKFQEIDDARDQSDDVLVVEKDRFFGRSGDEAIHFPRTRLLLTNVHFRHHESNDRMSNTSGDRV